MFGTCQFQPGALTRNLACDKVKVTPVTVLEGKAGSRKMRTVKPGQGPSLSHISLQYVNFGVFLRFSDAIENILNPFTYYFHAVRISDAVRSPLSQARAGGGGGDAHGKALVPVRTSVSRDGGGGCRRRSGKAFGECSTLSASFAAALVCTLLSGVLAGVRVRGRSWF